MKLRLLAASVAALGLTAGIASAQTAPAPQAPAPAPVAANKPVLSYAIGYDLGKDLAQQNVDVDINAVIRALQDLSLIHISEPRDRSLSRMPSSA